MVIRGKAPTFTSDAQGYLCNPLSDSGISWWHMTSPFTPEIEREEFRIPSYFSSDVDTLCGVAESMNRPNPISLYEVKLRIRPENLLSPQTIFKDWLQSWYLTREDDDGNEWDAQNGEANPWFSSPAFVDTLTPLGKRFYYEVASAECYFSKAEIMSLVCECVYNVFDILKNVGPNLFENWCLRNDIYGWVEAEFRDGGWVQDASEMWVPEDGFNIGVWDTSRVEIVNVFPDAVDCEEEWEASSVIGRKNPKDYIINPNTGGRIWWYVTDERRPEFRTGDEDHRFTWFGGVREDWEDFGQFNLAITKKYLLEVQIEAPAGCAVFDARRLFPNMPQWVEDSLRRSTQIDAEELDSEEGYAFIENVRPMAIEADTYRFFQNMRIADPSLDAFCSTFDRDWLRTEFLIKLWLLDYFSVQTFLEGSEYTEQVDTPIVGWYEIERVDYNYHTAINLGLYMAEPANLASHSQGCSDIKIDIVNAISNSRTSP